MSNWQQVFFIWWVARTEQWIEEFPEGGIGTPNKQGSISAGGGVGQTLNRSAPPGFT
jgi:hypothetical protein